MYHQNAWVRITQWLILQTMQLITLHILVISNGNKLSINLMKVKMRILIGYGIFIWKKNSRRCNFIRIHWMLSRIFKASKKVYEVIFFFLYVKVYIFWKCIQYTIHWHKTQMFKNFLRTKQTVQSLFFFAISNSSRFYF